MCKKAQDISGEKEMNSKDYKLKAKALLKIPGIFRGAMIGVTISIIMNVIMSFFQDSTLLVQKAPYQILSIINLFVSPIIGMSLNYFLIKAAKSNSAETRYTLSYGIKYAGKAIWLSIITIVFIVLWILLLIVPGVIAALRYSQSAKILAENPTITAREALNRSKEMMRGKLGKYLVLNLSFIWWFLLVIIGIFGFVIIFSSFALLLNLTNSLYTLFIAILTKIVLYGALIPFIAYLATANTYFYLENKVVESQAETIVECE